MSIFSNAGAGDHFVDDTLVFRFHQVFHLVGRDPQMVKRLVRDQIDLIDQNPLLTRS